MPTSTNLLIPVRWARATAGRSRPTCRTQLTNVRNVMRRFSRGRTTVCAAVEGSTGARRRRPSCWRRALPAVTRWPAPLPRSVRSRLTRLSVTPSASDAAAARRAERRAAHSRHLRARSLLHPRHPCVLVGALPRHRGRCESHEDGGFRTAGAKLPRLSDPSRSLVAIPQLMLNQVQVYQIGR